MLQDVLLMNGIEMFAVKDVIYGWSTGKEGNQATEGLVSILFHFRDREGTVLNRNLCPKRSVGM